MAISEPDLRQTQLVIVGATGMVGGYALKDLAVGSATSIWRQLPSTRIGDVKVTRATSLDLSRVASALLR